MAMRDTVAFWVFLAVYFLAMLAVGVAIGYLTAPAPPAPPPATPAQVVGTEP